jgi:glutamate dehydrogenase/leucine dehydrogenase
MARDATVAECARLARAMTLKNSAAGLGFGGGKAVIAADPRMPAADKERLVRGFAGLIREQTDYIAGPDMGTDEGCMAWIRDEIGRAAGLPEELGGIPLDRMGATGFGLAHAVEVAAPHCGLELAGARVVVQGFGAVGSHAARFLRERGAVLVGASDSRGSVHDERGLDVDALTRAKATGKSLAESGLGEAGDADAVLDMACEVWIPAARPDVVHDANVGRLRAKLVAEGANIPLTPGAERALADRGVLVLPDFIANAGGVIAAAVELRGGDPEDAFGAIERRIRANVARVLAAARERGVLPRDAALALAAQRVRTAMGYGRWR